LSSSLLNIINSRKVLPVNLPGLFINPDSLASNSSSSCEKNGLITSSIFFSKLFKLIFDFIKIKCYKTSNCNFGKGDPRFAMEFAGRFC